MADVIVQFSPEHAGKSKEEKEALLDAEIERFSKYMEGLPDPKSAGKLHPMERMLLKSFLIFRVKEGQ